MHYRDLSVGMRLIANRSDGTKKELVVVRKGLDGFGIKSVVLQSTTSSAQFYYRAEEIPYLYIELKKEI